MDYTTDATTIDYKTDYTECSSSTSTSYSQSSNSNSGNITVVKEEPEKTSEQKHQELIDKKINNSEDFKRVAAAHEVYKERINNIVPVIVELYDSAINNLGLKKYSEIEANIRNHISQFLPGSEAIKFVAKIAVKFKDYSQKELNQLRADTLKWPCESITKLISIPSKEVIFQIINYFNELDLIPSKEDITNYRQEILPTKIPAFYEAKEIGKRYLSLISTASKKEIDNKKVGEARSAVEEQKRQELIDKDEYREGEEIKVFCGEIVVNLVENYPHHAERLKKLCPDIYKRKSATQKQLEAEIAKRKAETAKREKLEIEVSELKEKGKAASLFQEFMLKDPAQKAAFEAFLKTEAS